MNPLFDRIDAIVKSEISLPEPLTIGYSREGRFVHAFRFGSGKFQVSLLAGCHADEPTGPRLLRKFVSFLSRLKPRHPLIEKFSWRIIPHANPDGEKINQKWYSDADVYYDLSKYIQFVSRELPGDDMEFGFPTVNQPNALRPENKAIFHFWKSNQQPFQLHLSLHGMGIAFGPWFLIEPAWSDKADEIKSICKDEVREMGYYLHDMDRKGEKGFFRMEKGFCTRPDSKYMKQFFLRQKDTETAEKFYPSSMEAIRSLGGNCLTLVSEMPLFIIPKTSEDVKECTNEYFEWKKKLQALKRLLPNEETLRDIMGSIKIEPMPIMDQMRLQLVFLASGIEQVLAEKIIK